MLERRHFFFSLAGAGVVAQAQNEVLDWYDARKFTVEGLGFKDRKSPFDRLPARAENVVRDVVWNLSRDSSGVLVRFTANSRAIHARWTVTSKTLAAVTMSATAASGLDLYARTDAGKWHWLGIARPTKFPENTDALATTLPPGQREYMLYLPLRNGVTSLEIGVVKGSSIAAAPVRPKQLKPFVFYGTSITHGIAASRPGMTHVAILGRMFQREVINLGFSGNGKMEPEVTKFIAELDPSVFILDCLPNMTDKDINERAEACVMTLREARPNTPILLVEDRNYADDVFNASRRERNETNHKAMRAVYAKLLKDKVPHLHYLKGEELLSADGDDTIDGSHPTDLGFLHQATAFQKVLQKILK